ncbi:MAG: ATP-binding protein [Myxococcaceae bacterium]|jgi:DNA gyrase subunit B|nr:ATP-binding protein [Myxococcaceae bacterium]
MAARRDESGYSIENIVVLEGLEPVRVRPGLYIGGTDQRGLLNMLNEVIANALDEHLAGRATRVGVTVEPTGWIAVRDDGGGMPVEATRLGRPILEVVLTSLHSGATADGHHPHIHAGRLAGVGISVVNALSERFEIVTRRSGRRWEAGFARGRVVESFADRGASSARGTTVRFLPDAEIFGDARLDLHVVRRQLQEVAWLMPSLRLSLQGRRLRSEHGLVDALSTFGPMLPGTMLQLRESRDGVGFELAIGLSRTPQPERRFATFVNYQRIERGPHQRAIEKALSAAFDDGQRLLSRVVCACHLTMLDPRFEGPTKAVLHLPEAVPHLTELIANALSEPTDTRIAWLEALRTG